MQIGGVDANRRRGCKSAAWMQIGGVGVNRRRGCKCKSAAWMMLEKPPIYYYSGVEWILKGFISSGINSAIDNAADLCTEEDDPFV